MRFFITAYPEDLLDEGVETVLDRIQGVLGVNGLTLIAAAAPFERIRGRAIEPRITRSRGGIYFKPAEAQYASTRCKPIASSRARAADPVARIVGSCDQRGLAIRLAIHAATMGRLAERYRDAACKNALDDVSHRSVCLHNSDVQALLGELIADLSSRGELAGVELRDFACGWYDAYDDRLVAPGRLGTATRALLSLCFCESCLQRSDQAGIDGASARRFVASQVNDLLESGEGEGSAFGVFVEQSEPLARYLTWRAGERLALLGQLRERTSTALIIREFGDSASAPPYPSLPSESSFRISRVQSLSPVISDQRCGDAGVSEYACRFNPVHAQDGAALVSQVSAWRRWGAEAITLDDYGLWTEDAMTSVKQAVRFARRA